MANVRIPMVDLSGQYQKLKPALDLAISKVMDSCSFIQGPAVFEFQQKLAQYLGSKYVITCGNGTDALIIALLALDLQPGDEVITSPFSFVAAAEAAALLRLKPVFVDVCPDTFNLDVSLLEDAITPRTRAIIPVHLFGQCADMETIMDVAKRHNLFVIEDACQAIGAEFIFRNGSRAMAGTIGHIGCTSFFPSKNLGCYGDGGALFTNDDRLAEKMKALANHGSFEKYHHVLSGMNSRLDSIQAAILSVKLDHLDEFTDARREAAARYDTLLADNENFIIPAKSSYSTHVYHQYTLKLQNIDRDEVRERLNEAGIANMIYYPVPLHQQEVFKTCGYQSGDFPVAEQLASEVLSIPMHTELTESIQTQVVSALLNR